MWLKRLTPLLGGDFCNAKMQAVWVTLIKASMLVLSASVFQG
jgi:hypothetical protein